MYQWLDTWYLVIASKEPKMPVVSWLINNSFVEYMF